MYNEISGKMRTVRKSAVKKAVYFESIAIVFRIQQYGLNTICVHSFKNKLNVNIAHKTRTVKCFFLSNYKVHIVVFVLVVQSTVLHSNYIELYSLKLSEICTCTYDQK